MCSSTIFLKRLHICKLFNGGYDIEFYYCVAGAVAVFEVQKIGSSEAKEGKIILPKTEVKVMVIWMLILNGYLLFQFDHVKNSCNTQLI